jgi:two-component system, response regulator PdtaR
MAALAQPTVLTVEDDPIVRTDLRLILEDAGFDVRPARDGVEAVALARQHRPDLVLIDLGLPRLDGVEATRRIRSERDVPVVALTGYQNGELVERAREAGAAAHVLKPFSERTLVTTVRDTLAEHEAEHNHLRIMIERMVREGANGWEIEHAVMQASSWGTPSRPSRVSSWARSIAKLGSRSGD